MYNLVFVLAFSLGLTVFYFKGVKDLSKRITKPNTFTILISVFIVFIGLLSYNFAYQNASWINRVLRLFYEPMGLSVNNTLNYFGYEPKTGLSFYDNLSNSLKIFIAILVFAVLGSFLAHHWVDKLLLSKKIEKS